MVGPSWSMTHSVPCYCPYRLPRCCVVEDSRIGMLAAKAAGMT